MRFFITGAAGFIGFHLAQRLLRDGHTVLGLDGMTDYYDLDLKHRRNAILQDHDRYQFVRVMLQDRLELEATMAAFVPDVIVHLAAQAGVRHSLTHPDAYITDNILGTHQLLEVARKHRPKHLLLASTSAVYGGNALLPFGETQRSDFPLSLYAATKKACEVMSHSYAHLWNIPTTCIRFFTVYGTWGRPDMALYKFVDAAMRSQPIEIYGMGKMKREVTHVGDLVEGIMRLVSVVPGNGHPITSGNVVDSLSPVAPWRTVNIAGGNGVSVMEMVDTIERLTGRTIRKEFCPDHKGEAVETKACSTLIQALTGYTPATDFEETAREFVDWFRDEGYRWAAGAGRPDAP
jgi:UDP-glucuronate 4-epimerase